MNKKYFFIIIPFGLSFCCFVTYNIIGSEIAPDGTLVEPFFLIPMGFLFFAIGIITTVFMFVRYLFKKVQTSSSPL